MDHTNGSLPGLTFILDPGNGLDSHPMIMCGQGLHMCMPNIYKRVSFPDPMLTFWLTMVENTSLLMIPFIDTHWVSSSLNTFAVELFFLMIYHLLT